MMDVQRMMLRLALPFALIAACGKTPVEPISTGEFAVTGVAIVTGTVMGVNGAPLDSFVVFGSVQTIGGREIYPVPAFSYSAANGRYSLRVQRLIAAAPFAPDSVRFLMRAESRKAGDRNADGSPRSSALVEMWLRFAKPPLAPSTVTVDLPVPAAR